ncbi:pyridoxal phosphate-dependent aminotransferase [Actinocorallia sp. API 0066]|uniref:pyridoxal phosphate-dependent aminotransferase n=1 Tax=Actinocorallia sp. API 0066 TaxID=2896846 RepID=UPI001E376E02|nr:pyridoxal phosphate-dependent aminotransferase [Actinocorallia sp. API 0066]MCD0451617.1 pyridoxal phosphate-dependent aminotransferase [Actinocorallia sp. API 0066]
MTLFATPRAAVPAPPPQPDRPPGAAARPRGTRLDPAADAWLADVFDRARDPSDPFELRDLVLGQVEARLGRDGRRPELAERWRAATPRRRVTGEEILGSRATVRMVKELFNHYFRDDLYGVLRPRADLILSGGSVDEEVWGLPGALKDAVTYALSRDWYGYSDSRGRASSREAVAAYESARAAGPAYGPENIALTMGATFTISMLADFILLHTARTAAPALCAIPNYPPLVESVARRKDVRLVPTPSEDGTTTLRPLIDALRPDTPLVLLQTAANPTGAVVREAELAELIRAADPATMIILDECHEWLGPVARPSAARSAPNVVRVTSLSKTWSAPGLKIGWIIADAAFIDEYYEFASSTFGGPPSVFYTLVEVLARLERWLITSVEDVTGAHLAEFDPGYGMDLASLQRAYTRYREERLSRTDSLTALREAATARLDLPGISVTPAVCSINVALSFDGYDNSYLCFRSLLNDTGVSVFPGILTFCLSGGVARVTTARRWDELSTAIDRLARHRPPGGVRPR